MITLADRSPTKNFCDAENPCTEKKLRLASSEKKLVVKIFWRDQKVCARGARLEIGWQGDRIQAIGKRVILNLLEAIGF